MPDSSITLFLITSLVLIATPGQDMVLVMSRSVALGTRAGVLTAAGVSVGLLGHTVLAALGLGALLQASEMLFIIMKGLGAMYLVYLGIKTFSSPPIDFTVQSVAPRSSRRLFVQGALSNLSNPKVAIFYFAYLPQFVSSNATNFSVQLFTLGVTFALRTFLVKGPIGFAAGVMSSWLRARPAVQVGLNRVTGTILVGLGVRLAFESQTSR